MNEIRQVTPAFFDFRHKMIVIPANVAKAKRSQTVPIHKTLIKPIKELTTGKLPEDRLFAIGSKQTINTELRADCAAAGIDTKNISFHGLRHTFCTLLARENVHPALLQKLARHSDLNTTLKYYVHLQRSDESEAINKLP